MPKRKPDKQWWLSLTWQKRDLIIQNAIARKPRRTGGPSIEYDPTGCWRDLIASGAVPRNTEPCPFH